MSEFLRKRDVDNVFFRNTIAGLLGFLQDKLKIPKYVAKDKTITYDVLPFYYSFGGDERFLQDLFLQHTTDDYIDNKGVEGNIDVLPRGTVTLTGITVNASSLTNRFIEGEFIQENEDGIIETYIAPINSIPINLTFNIEIFTASKVQSFKILEQILKTFYKMHSYNYIYNWQSIRAHIGFPEDQSVEQTYEFSFADPTMNKIPFSLEVQTYIPVPDTSVAFTKDQSRVDNISVSFKEIAGSEGLSVTKDSEGYKYFTFNEQTEALRDGFPRDSESIDTSRPTGLTIKQVDGVYVVVDKDGNILPNIDVNDIDVDHNIHNMNAYGIPTSTLNDVLKK